MRCGKNIIPSINCDVNVKSKILDDHHHMIMERKYTRFYRRVTTILDDWIRLETSGSIFYRALVEEYFVPVCKAGDMSLMNFNLYCRLPKPSQDTKVKKITQTSDKRYPD